MKTKPVATLWLAALVVLAPWPAFSQVSSELAAESMACETLEDIASLKDLVCENSGFLCRPDPSECERFCENATRTCFRSGRSTMKSRTLLVRSEFRGLARLCAGESDSSLCRRLLRDVAKSVKSEVRQFLGDLRESCGNEDFQSACNEACLEPSAVSFDCSLESLEAGATTTDPGPVPESVPVMDPEAGGFEGSSGGGSTGSSNTTSFGGAGGTALSIDFGLK